MYIVNLEGLAVLYGTNTFHIDTRGLDYNPLMDLLPASHLFRIRSLEWATQPYIRGSADNSHPQGLPRWKVVRALPITALPSLKKLYIGFRECTTLWDTPEDCEKAPDRERHLGYTERILEPLDMLISTGIADGVEDLEIGILTIAFIAHMMRGTGEMVKCEKPDWTLDTNPELWTAWGPRHRYWREVGGQPKEGEHEARGYWLSESTSDASIEWWPIPWYWR